MPTRGRSPTVRSGSRRQRARRVSRSRSLSSIVRQPTRTGGYLWGPSNSYLSQYSDPFPAKANYVLRYSDQITLNPAAGATSSYFFHANSIYDPDQTGVGHQPYGHDTLQTIYKEYVVDKAVITLVPTQFGNTVCTYGVRTCDDGVGSSFHLIRETKGSKLATTAVGARPLSISSAYNRKKMWPVEKDTSALFGTNPQVDAYFQIFMQGPNGTVDPGSVDFMVNITYYVTCFDMKPLASS